MPNWCTNRLTVLDKGDGTELQKFVDAIGRPPEPVEDDSYEPWDLTLPYPTPEVLLGTRSPGQTVEQVDEMRAKRDAGEMKAHENYTGDVHEPTGSWVTDEYLQEMLDGIERNKKAKQETGFPDWYSWNIAHWGTKWSPDVYDCSVAIDADGGSVATISYQTAWSPAEPLILELSKRFPSLQFVEAYLEEGMGFWGANTYIKGEQRHGYVGEHDGDSILAELNDRFSDPDLDGDQEAEAWEAVSSRWMQLMERAETDALHVGTLLDT